MYIKENQLKLTQSGAIGLFSKGQKRQVRNRRSKRAISIRATEVLLYSITDPPVKQKRQPQKPYTIQCTNVLSG